MQGKDYASLSKHLVVIDFNDGDAEPDLLAAVAIRPEFAEAFLEEVESIAVEKYGGATFEELYDNDLEDKSAFAAQDRYFSDQATKAIEEAEGLLNP